MNKPDLSRIQLQEFDIEEHTILLALGGSKSYGTDHPLSDTDWRGVCVAPLKTYISPFRDFEQTAWKNVEADEEGTIFGIDKFVKLASACNPNVIETLFGLPEHLAICTEEGKLLIENRMLFLSQRAAHTFCGYATSQLKRIETHKKWIDNPPDHLPTREEFGLPPEKRIPGEQLEAAAALVRRNTNAMAPWLVEASNTNAEAFWEGVQAIVALADDPDSWLDVRQAAEDAVASRLGFDANFIQYVKAEKAWARARFQHKQYHNWVKNRNPARADLETRYGYDCKHASHLVRLLRMGKEVVVKGELNVYRYEDREELIEIRNGSLTYEELIVRAKSETNEIYNIVRSGASVLPAKPNNKKIEELALEIIDRVHKRT